MISILHILTLRTIILMASSVFSVAFVMLMVGIVTIDDIIKILVGLTFLLLQTIIFEIGDFSEFITFD